MNMHTYIQVGALREQLRLEKAGKTTLEERNNSASDNISACYIFYTYICVHVCMYVYTFVGMYDSITVC